MAGQGSGCSRAEKELIPQLMLEWGGQVPMTDGRKRRAGGGKDISKEASWGSGGEGLLQNLGLCLRDCIMGDKFTAKLLSYEGYHRYISVTGGAWGKKVWRVRVGAEY